MSSKEYVSYLREGVKANNASLIINAAKSVSILPQVAGPYGARQEAWSQGLEEVLRRYGWLGRGFTLRVVNVNALLEEVIGVI